MPSPDWRPPADWSPPPAWGDPPPNWPLWVEDSPRRRGAMLAGLKHPAWVSIGTVISVAALVLTVVQLVPLRSGADIEIAALSVQSAEPIKADFVKTGLLDRSPAHDESATAIEIAIKNNGDTAIRFTTITAEVLDTFRWECPRGGGGAFISAEYTLRLPWIIEDDGARTQLQSVSASIDLRIAEASIERVAMTVGPEDAHKWPVVTFTRLIFSDASGAHRVTTAPVALITEPSNIDDHLSQASTMTDWLQDCNREHVSSVRAALDDETVTSAALDRWIDGLDRLAPSHG